VAARGAVAKNVTICPTYACTRTVWGVFIIAVHRAFVLGLGARHRGIVELSKGS